MGAFWLVRKDGGLRYQYGVDQPGRYGTKLLGLVFGFVV
jgi:hypothetical protein